MNVKIMMKKVLTLMISVLIFINTLIFNIGGMRLRREFVISLGGRRRRIVPMIKIVQF